MISTSTKLNMSLDEINYVEKLEKQLEKKNILENNFKNLNNLYIDLYNKYSENLEVVELEDWIIHKTYSNNEFISGYKTTNQFSHYFNNDNLWKTSNIISKTPTKYGLFIITKTEHIYYLPYNESYY
jgi:hypothetical protein